MLRADCWCSSAAHTLPQRAARVGRCLRSSTALVVVLQKRLHEHINSTPVKLLITRSIKFNNVTLLLKAAVLSVAFSLPPVPLYGSLPLRGRPGTALLRDRRFTVDALVLHGR